MADVILHDPRIGPDILALARRDARKIAMEFDGLASEIATGFQGYLTGSTGQGEPACISGEDPR
jgi:hypothetical protein